MHTKIISGDYSVDDSKVTTKSRGAYQKIFSENVKNNYQNECAITGIKTGSLLIGSHIVPWSKDKTKRLDPKNGVCLSVVVDKCFDDGLITIDHEYRVVLSKKVKDDVKLFNLLEKYQNKRITLPTHKELYPDFKNLDYHWKNVFKK